MYVDYLIVALSVQLENFRSRQQDVCARRKYRSLLLPSLQPPPSCMLSLEETIQIKE